MPEVRRLIVPGCEGSVLPDVLDLVLGAVDSFLKGLDFLLNLPHLER
jgi:hypothetical protein